MSVLSKLMYIFNVIQIQIKAIYSVAIDKSILKFLRRGKNSEWPTKYWRRKQSQKTDANWFQDLQATVTKIV